MDNQTQQTNLNELHQDLTQSDATKYLKIKSISLMIIAIIAVIFALDWAHSFFITLILSIFIAYVLNPLVNWLGKIKIPRIVGSSVIIAVLITCISLAL